VKKLNPFKRSDRKHHSVQENNIQGDLINIAPFFYSFTGFGLVMVGWYTGFNSSSATPLLWSLAFFIIGSAFGFLFGIPKILQSDKQTDQSAGVPHSDYRQQVNTNLTEISDWLTKIIVGLGLIQLSKISLYLDKIAYALAHSMNPTNPDKDKAFALGIVLCFSVLGFLFGYLFTWLYLQGAFSRADQGASTILQTQITTLNDRQDLLNSLDATNVNQNTADIKLDDESKTNVSKLGIINIEAIPPNEQSDDNTMIQFKNLADNYLAIWDSDKNERIRAKNESSKMMFNFTIKNNISKDKILEEADKTGNQGIILALTNMIFAYPENRDDERLLRVAYRVDRWHIQYRIVQALGLLIDKNYVSKDNFESINNILARYEKDGDQSIINLIKGTRTLIANKLQNNVK
jgi:hypothetical protein